MECGLPVLYTKALGESTLRGKKTSNNISGWQFVDKSASKRKVIQEYYIILPFSSICFWLVFARLWRGGINHLSIKNEARFG